MIVTFPHLSHAWVALKALFDKNGVECIVPPQTTQRTVSLGTQYSPEWMCMPYKILLGNLIEALEQGADTVLDVGGSNLCRLGYYARLHEEALRALGFDFQTLVFDWQDGQIVSVGRFVRNVLGPQKPWLEIIGDIKFGIQQLMLLDDLEKRVHYLRPRAIEPNAVSRLCRSAPQRVVEAHTPRALKQAREEIFGELEAMPLDPDARPLKIAFVGEFFMVVDTFCNMDLEEELGRRGVEVVRTHWLTEWAKSWLFLEAVGMSHGQKVKRAAAPYLRRDVSGDAMDSLGTTALGHEEGLGGVIHILPFTCMPELISLSILPKIAKEHDIPVLSLVRDEQSGKAGVLTRIEAFIDLLERRRARRPAART